MKKYITDVQDEILKVVRRERRVLLNANAGSGKTKFVNDLCLETDVCVITPMNSVLTSYQDVAIYSRTLDSDVFPDVTCELPEDGSVVMNFDNAVRSWRYILERNFEYLVIDESHELFASRTYRECAIELMKLLKNYDGYLICVSASPLGEVEALSLHVIDNKYPFMRCLNRCDIEYCFVETDGAGVTARDLMRETAADYYFYFSDRNAVIEYGNALYEGLDACLFKSELLTFGDECRKVLESKHLTHKYNFATTSMQAGVNILNEGEVCVIIPFQSGMLYNVMVQVPARFRNAHVVCYVLFGVNEPIDIRKRKIGRNAVQNAAVIDANEASLEGFNVPTMNNSITANAGYEDAMREIEEYCARESDKDVIQKRLENLLFEVSEFDNKGCRHEKIDNYRRRLMHTMLNDEINKVDEEERILHCKNEFERQMLRTWERKINGYKAKMGEEGMMTIMNSVKGTKLGYKSFFEMMDGIIPYMYGTKAQLAKAKQTLNNLRIRRENRLNEWVELKKFSQKEKEFAMGRYNSTVNKYIRYMEKAIEYFPKGSEEKLNDAIRELFSCDELFVSGETISANNSANTSKPVIAYGDEIVVYKNRTEFKKSGYTDRVSIIELSSAKETDGTMKRVEELSVVYKLYNEQGMQFADRYNVVDGKERERVVRRCRDAFDRMIELFKDYQEHFSHDYRKEECPF